jgi:dihydroorotate dehydrogenase (NAD+) catalytic subunit
MTFGTDLTRFAGLLEKVRAACRCPLIVKLSPNVTDIAEFAVLAEKIGADAVSAVNTYLGMKIDTASRRPHFENRVAGLSGPAIRPLAVRAVYQIYEKVTIPVIGLGGISSLGDALEFFMAGASAISVGTMNMVDPALSVDLLEALREYLAGEKYTSLSGIIGAAHEGRSAE